MLDLGTVKPGSHITIPFDSFDGGTGASSAMTGNAVGDILVYKDAGTTERASTAGYTFTVDFDTKTGLNIIRIDLADNTTANFFEAGSEYLVGVGDVKVDAQTVRFWAARFVIGYPGAILDTTFATLASQTSFTLEDGSADNDAYNGSVVVIHDLASSVQIAQGFVQDYTGSTKTVTLAVDPGIFTMAAGDSISVFPRADVGAISGDLSAADNLESAADNYSATRGLAGTALPAAAADAAGGLPISDAGGLDIDAKLANTNEITVARMGALTDWINGGRLDLLLDAILADTGTDGVALLAATQASIDAIETDTNSLNDTKIPDTISLANINAEVDTAFTTQMADSVSTDGSIATREQAIYMILQFLTERKVSGTTVTIEKVDGSTDLFTLTLDDGSDPSTITRAT